MTRADRKYVAALLAFAAALTIPLWGTLWNLPVTDDADALQNLSVAHVVVDAVRSHGEYPLWNPYFGGGIPWAGYVYNSGISLQSLIYVTVGAVAGVKLWTMGIMLLGAFGMYGTAREWLGLDRLAALAAGLLYTASAWLPGVLASGDYDFQGYFILPFVALCMFWLLRRRPLGLLLPLCYMTEWSDGAKWWPIITALTVLVVALVYRARSGNRLATVALVWAAAFGCGLGLASPKLLPLTQLMRMDLVDQVASREWIAFEGLGDVLRAALSGIGDPNLDISTGVGGVFFAGCGVLLDWRRSLGLFGILIVTVIFALGPASPLPVVAILTAVPLINTMGSYGMYGSLVIVFCTCGIAGIGFERLRALVAASQLPKSTAAPDHHTDRLVVGLAAGTVAFLAFRALVVYATLFTVTDYTASREPFHHVAYRDLVGSVDRYRETPLERPEANQYHNIRKGVGTITWLGNMVFPEHARASVLVDREGRLSVQEGYRGEVYCVNAGGPCEAGDLQVTYNTIRFHVTNSDAATVVVNQNFDSGWSSTVGPVTSHEGLLAVRVPAGELREVLLRFSDSLFLTGLAIAAVSAVLWCVGGAVWCRRSLVAPHAGERV